MTQCCDSSYGPNPYGTLLNYDENKSAIWETVDSRQRVIKRISTALCPITCPIWTTCSLLCCSTGCLCLLCNLGCNKCSLDEDYNGWRWCIEGYQWGVRFFLCLPPYENNCTLLFCSVFNQHNTWCGVDVGQSCCRGSEPWDEPITLADFATGPERQAMGWPDIIDRRKTRKEETARAHEAKHSHYDIFFKRLREEQPKATYEQISRQAWQEVEIKYPDLFKTT